MKIKLSRRDIEGVIPHRRHAQFLDWAVVDTDSGEVTAAFRARKWMCDGHMDILPGHFMAEGVNLAIAIAAMHGKPPKTQVLLRETGNGKLYLKVPQGALVTVTGRVNSCEVVRRIFLRVIASGEATVGGKRAFTVPAEIKAVIELPEESGENKAEE